MPCPSATMVVWASAWLHGAVASDDVLDAVQAWSEVHDVHAQDEELGHRLDLPEPGGAPASLGLLLAALRKEAMADGELVLPVPGDVRGLGGQQALVDHALRCGEAAVFPSSGLALVPQRDAEGILHWTVFSGAELDATEHMPISEAEHGMSSAMREAASTLIDLDIAKQRPGVREEIAKTVASRPKQPWPEDTPKRPLRVLQRAAEVEAILWVATDDAPGGALSASATRARMDALKPLFNAVRAARRASVAEMVRVLADRANQH